jgi:hypothetical protein
MEGLRNAGKSPQLYILSDVLASFQKGVQKNITSVKTIRYKDDSVADGGIDFYVPLRTRAKVPFFRRLYWAWVIFNSRADVLLYR